jgi:hypothetical protein
VCAETARMWLGTAIGPHRCPRQHSHAASLSSRIQGNAVQAPATKGALAHDFSTRRSDQTSRRASRLMRAIEVSTTGGPEVLAYVERPVPEPAPGQLLIKTEAIGVNFVDTYFRTGLYPHSLPFILGSEVAAVGEGVQTAQVGDRVATSDADGAYAEYCLAPADLVSHVPDGVSAEVAASAILKGQTAHLLIKSVYLVGSGSGRRPRIPRRARHVRREDPCAHRRCGRRGGVRRGRQVDVRRQPGQPGSPRNAGPVRRVQRAPPRSGGSQDGRFNRVDPLIRAASSADG